MFAIIIGVLSIFPVIYTMAAIADYHDRKITDKVKHMVETEGYHKTREYYSKSVIDYCLEN